MCLIRIYIVSCLLKFNIVIYDYKYVSYLVYWKECEGVGLNLRWLSYCYKIFIIMVSCDMNNNKL